MPPAKKPTAHFTLSKQAPYLLSILGFLFTIWSHQDNAARQESGQSAELAEFKRSEIAFDQKLEAQLNERFRNVWTALNAHHAEAAAEHEQMRHDWESYANRQIDLLLQSKFTPKVQR